MSITSVPSQTLQAPAGRHVFVSLLTELEFNPETVIDLTEGNKGNEGAKSFIVRTPRSSSCSAFVLFVSFCKSISVFGFNRYPDSINLPARWASDGSRQRAKPVLGPRRRFLRRFSLT